MAMQTGKFGKERKDALERVYRLPPGKKALEQLAYVRREFDFAIPGYVRLLNIIKDTTYQDRRHFLLELIQNADDANFLSSEAPSLTFIINDDSLELHYNEEGFTAEDVVAITDAGFSTKADVRRLTNSFIGEKGIGFKSVFALASSVEIHSPPWHFILKEDACVVPVIPRHQRSMDMGGTSLKILFTEHTSIELVANELNKYVEGQIESFLFLQNLSIFILEDRRRSTAKKTKLVLDGRKTGKLFLEIHPRDELREYILYEEESEFPAELVSERWEELVGVGSLKRRMAVAALADATSEGLSEGRLYCFLPTEVRLPIPIYLHVDGHTKADRERLQDAESNNWNRHLFKLLPDFLLRALLHWREDPDLSKRLPDFVPTDENHDQLSQVFNELYQHLQKAPWIRTYESGKYKWVTPENAIRIDRTWHKWLSQYPDFRRSIEVFLGKRFLHPDWMVSSKWAKKWDLYNIAKVNEQQFIDILSQVELPSELLVDDDNLVRLYNYILRFNFEANPDYREKLLKAKMFPLEGNRFGALHEGGHTKLFWVNVRSKRDTGLEEYCKIINPEYTYRPDAGRDPSKERIEEVRRISNRNNTVCELLKELGVSELNDETLLSEVQIPRLLDSSGITLKENKARLNILHAIFVSYRAKRIYDQPYLDQLIRLSTALFYSNGQQFKKLEDLILPRQLRLKEIDRLYAKAGLDEFQLSLNYLYVDEAGKPLEKQKVDRLKEVWRDFLIHCGIRAVPRFELKEDRYGSPWHFHEEDSARFDIWRGEIRSNFTGSNRVDIQRQELDQATQKVLLSSDYPQALMAKVLHQIWLKNVEGQINCISHPGEHYSYEPPPGYFKAVYLRHYDRAILVKDDSWGGIDPSMIPLETVNNQVLLAYKTRGVALKKLKDIVVTRKYFPLVASTDNLIKIKKSNIYHVEYLNSLSVQPLSMADVNDLWQSKGCPDLQDIIKIIIELLRIGVSKSELELYDYAEKRFRSATDFKLGDISAPGVPLIEEQYPQVGTTLGELLGLEVLNEVAHFSGLITSMIDNYPEGGSDEQFYKLTIRINSWHYDDRYLIRQELKEAMESNQLSFPPVIILNDVELLKRYQEAGVITFGIKVIPSEKHLVEKGFREIGLYGHEDIGELVAEGSQTLSDTDSKLIDTLIGTYLNILEEDERSQLVAKLGEYRDIVLLTQQIYQVRRIVKVYQHSTNSLTYELPLPYYNRINKQFYLRYGDTPEMIVAFLLYSLDVFPSMRIALREISEVILPTSELDDKSQRYGRDKKENERANGSSGRPRGRSLPGQDVEEVADQIKSALKETREMAAAGLDKASWKTAIDPEVEEQIRRSIGGERLLESLGKGPEIHKKRLRRHLKKHGRYNVEGDEKIVDTDALDPKEFLQKEYRGICQSCHKMLRLANGKNHFEVLRIVEHQGEIWWADRPFNVLCLCPNCHALAKHGGWDFKSIYTHAQDLLVGSIFPQEVISLSGDFYIVPVTINQTERKLAFSPLHMNYLASLFETAEKFSSRALSAPTPVDKNLLKKMQDYYFRLKVKLGYRPSRLALYKASRTKFKEYFREGWLRFLHGVGELQSEEESWIGTPAEDFLYYLENTKMTKSYKIPVVSAFLRESGKVASSVALREIGIVFMQFYKGNSVHRRDFVDRVHEGWENWSLDHYVDLAKRNPVTYLAKGEFFNFDNIQGTLRLDESLRGYLSELLAEHIKDILEYRRLEYFEANY